MIGKIIFALNGTDLWNNPFNTTFGAYTDLLGSLFWLIPLSGIALALFVKTRSPAMVTGFLTAGSLLLSSGHMFLGAPEIATAYLIFSALCMTSLILSVYFNRRI